MKSSKMQVWGIMDECTRELIASTKLKGILEEAKIRRSEGHKVTSVPSQFAKNCYSF